MLLEIETQQLSAVRETEWDKKGFKVAGGRHSKTHSGRQAWEASWETKRTRREAQCDTQWGDIVEHTVGDTGKAPGGRQCTHTGRRAGRQSERR